ncbi:MAG: putative DNA binding domain-containing protein, partial [Bacteroidales bacterium]|nr:putative DNA binding domain-containing protein [Bacteroidales bacterium]
MALPINIEDLLRKRRVESDRIEFKKGWNPDKIFRTIAAFANDFHNIGGGYVLIGVEEEHGVAKRPVLGIPDNHLDKIQKEIHEYINKIEPHYLVRISVEQVDDRNVLVLWAPSGNSRPYCVPENVTSRHSFPKWYIRNGSTTVEANGDTLDELRDMANRVPFDERGNSSLTLKDINPLLVQDFLRRVGSSLAYAITTTNLEEILDSMNLYTGPTEMRYLKNVAAMMFCDEPEKFFPYTQIDVVTYPGGREADPSNFKEVIFKGPVHILCMKVLDYLKTHLVIEHISKPKDRAESDRYFNYPYQALEEAVVNCIYHRNYQEYEPVEISIEPHRVTFFNIGGPDRSITSRSLQEAKVLRARRYRNRRLGDFLKELGLAEARSSGIPTIQEELKRNGNAAATIETDDTRSYFLMDIPCHPKAITKLAQNGGDLVTDLVTDEADLVTDLVTHEADLVTDLVTHEADLVT